MIKLDKILWIVRCTTDHSASIIMGHLDKIWFHRPEGTFDFCIGRVAGPGEAGRRGRPGGGTGVAG